MDASLLIEREAIPGGVVLHLEGRIDSFWARHLDEYLDRLMREGVYTIGLNLGKAAYLSSHGIRVLIKYHKLLSKVSGLFYLCSVSPNVLSVLEMVGLSGLVNDLPSPVVPLGVADQDIELLRDGFKFILAPLPVDVPIEVQLHGDPTQLAKGTFSAADCRQISFNGKCYAIGLGALGGNFDEQAGRFGEFIGLGDGVVYLPSGENSSPDYLFKSGGLIPSITALYGISFTGSFDFHFRFSTLESGKTIAFSALLDQVFQLTSLDQFVMVMLAETSGMVGTALKRSPAAGQKAEDLFAFPAVRDNVYFTTQPEFHGTLAVAVGLAARNPDEGLQRFTRPMNGPSPFFQHFHAAVFSYYPLQKKNSRLQESLRAMFEEDKVMQLLHLLQDDRPLEGAGESRFTGGNCWISGFNTYRWQKGGKP